MTRAGTAGSFLLHSGPPTFVAHGWGSPYRTWQPTQEVPGELLGVWRDRARPPRNGGWAAGPQRPVPASGHQARDAPSRRCQGASRAAGVGAVSRPRTGLARGQRVHRSGCCKTAPPPAGRPALLVHLLAPSFRVCSVLSAVGLSFSFSLLVRPAGRRKVWLALSHHPSSHGSAPTLLSQAVPRFPCSLAPFPLPSAGLRMPTSLSSLQAIQAVFDRASLPPEPEPLGKRTVREPALLSAAAEKWCDRGGSWGRPATPCCRPAAMALR